MWAVVSRCRAAAPLNLLFASCMPMSCFDCMVSNVPMACKGKCPDKNATRRPCKSLMPCTPRKKMFFATSWNPEVWSREGPHSLPQMK